MQRRFKVGYRCCIVFQFGINIRPGQKSINEFWFNSNGFIEVFDRQHIVSLLRFFIGLFIQAICFLIYLLGVIPLCLRGEKR